MLKWLAAIVIVTAPMTAFSQDGFERVNVDGPGIYDGPNLDFLRVAYSGTVNVEIADQTENGCWVNPSATKSAVERAMVSKGFTAYRTYPENCSNLKLGLHVSGYDLGDPTGNGGSFCAVNVELVPIIGVAGEQHLTESKFIAESNYRRLIYLGGILITAPKNEINQMITDAYLDLVENLMGEAKNAQLAFMRGAKDKGGMANQDRKEFIDAIENTKFHDGGVCSNDFLAPPE